MPAAGRVVEVDASRLPGWVDRFADRHGPLGTTAEATSLVIAAPDGARAEITIPYGPLSTPSVDALVAHVLASRTVGVLLVRRGGWATGVVINGRLVAADTGGGYVQGSTKAGGWSQQRYARRRGNQAEQVWQRAANGAAAVLHPHRLDALVTGGDRTGVAAVLDDRRLSGLDLLAEPRLLAVPDPNRAVLNDVVVRLSAVAITLNERA